MSEKKKPEGDRGGVNISNIEGGELKVGGDIVGGDKIDVGDISGQGINIGSGDQTIHAGPSAPEIAQLFKPIYQQIESRPEDPDVGKEEIVETAEKIQEEVTKGEAANQNKLRRWLNTIQQMAPDIFDVVTQTLLSPAAGFAEVIKKVVWKAKEEAGKA